MIFKKPKYFRTYFKNFVQQISNKKIVAIDFKETQDPDSGVSTGVWTKERERKRRRERKRDRRW